MVDSIRTLQAQGQCMVNKMKMINKNNSIMKEKRKIFLCLVSILLFCLFVFKCKFKEPPTYPDEASIVKIKNFQIEPDPVNRLNDVNLSVEVEGIDYYTVEYFSEGNTTPLNGTGEITASWTAPVNAEEHGFIARIYSVEQNISAEVRRTLQVINTAPIIKDIQGDTIVTSLANTITVTVRDRETTPDTTIHVSATPSRGNCNPSSFNVKNSGSQALVWTGTETGTYTVNVLFNAVDDGNNSTSDTFSFSVQ